MNNLMSGQSNFAHASDCVIRALEGRKLTAVTHLALARRQNRRKRHFGCIQKFLQKIEEVQKHVSLQKILVDTDECYSTKENKIQKRNERLLLE